MSGIPPGNLCGVLILVIKSNYFREMYSRVDISGDSPGDRYRTFYTVELTTGDSIECRLHAEYTRLHL